MVTRRRGYRDVGRVRGGCGRCHSRQYSIYNVIIIHNARADGSSDVVEGHTGTRKPMREKQAGDGSREEAEMGGSRYIYI